MNLKIPHYLGTIVGYLPLLETLICTTPPENQLSPTPLAERFFQKSREFQNKGTKKPMKRSFIVFFAGLLVLSTGAFANTQGTNTNTVSPTLAISATIQEAVQLTLTTGVTAGVSHCAVVAAGGSPDYTMNFGTVDALGINAGNCNKFTPTTPGTTNAIYWTDYSLNPLYTSQATTGASTITAYVSANFVGPNISIVRTTVADQSTVPANAAAFTNMSTSSAAQDTIATAADMTGAGNGGTLNRFIGVGIAPTNGAANLTGLQTATVTFTMTIH